MIAAGVGRFNPGASRFPGPSVRGQERALPREVGGRVLRKGPRDLRRRRLRSRLDRGTVRKGALPHLGTPPCRVSGGAGDRRAHARAGRRGQDAIRRRTGRRACIPTIKGSRASVLDTNEGQRTIQVPADQVLAFYGLHPKLGPVAEWGLEWRRRRSRSTPRTFRPACPASSRSATSIPTRAKRS